jgi:hypothetical protein
MRLLLVGAVLLCASRGANAACVIHGARPTVPLPTMAAGQEFSFIASPDCETLRFTIRGTTFSKVPKAGGPAGPGPRTYKVRLTESEWDAVVAELDTTLTWVVTGRTSAGVMTRMITTNDLKRDETIALDLSRADAKLVGEEPDDHAGYSVSGAGDVDGDGHADLLVGAYENDAGGPHAGAAYLVRGPVTGTLDLSLADAKLVGDNAFGYEAGYSVSGAGDVDGDGHDDLLVGAEGDQEGGGFEAGAAYVVQGPVTGTLDLSLADAKLLGEEEYDLAGFSVSGAGDVDRDGHDDLLVGAPRPTYDGATYAGAAYLVLGPVTGTLDLSLADAKLVGETSADFVGVCVSGAGDVDGDGRDDFLVGSEYENGTAFLVLGPVTGTIVASSADAELRGEDDDHNSASSSVSGAGDVDADGHADLLVGAPWGGRGEAGVAYLVLGPVTRDQSLTRADATFLGSGGDHAGIVSDAGDVNRDGHDDVLVGATYGQRDDTGGAYLVLGPVMGTFELSDADVLLGGEEWLDEAGWSVSGAGDVDADGQDDLLVGAHRNDEGGDEAGAAYLIYGGGL